MPWIDKRDGLLFSEKLEFNLTFHCNFSCAHCSHFSPHLRTESASLNSFRRDIRALEKVYRVKRFRFVGGEPMLHKELLSFIDAVRGSRLAERIHVCTNGSLLHRADDAFFESIDILSISWYPDARIDQSKVDHARARCVKYGTKLKVERVNHFRRMDVDEPMNASLTGRIFRSCQIAHSWYCQTFYDGRFYLCSRPIFTGAYLEKKGIRAQEFESLDGIAIHEDGLYERLRDYVQRTEPLKSCRYCLGTVGKSERWQTLSREQRRNPPAIEKDAPQLINWLRMRFLLSANWIESRLTSLIPSPRMARVLAVIKNVPYHWSRSFSIRSQK